MRLYKGAVHTSFRQAHRLTLCKKGNSFFFRITNTKCVQGAELIILHKVVYIGLVINRI